MSDDDVFHRVSMVMNVDPAEIAKIVHDYIERGIINDYDRLNCPKPPIPIRPVKIKTLKERLEETKMNATSTQEIKNVKDISVTVENYPMEMESKLTVTATTDDDIFEFEFVGPDILQNCKKSGLFTGLEKDQKIRELEEKGKNISDDNALLLETNKKLREQIKKLERDDMLDKEAAEYWSKEHDILIERFAKLQEENKKLKDKVEHVEPFRSLERTIKEKQLLKEEYDILSEKHAKILKENKNLNKAFNASQKNCNKWYVKWIKMQEDHDILKRKYDLEKAANEAQHKFFCQYAGKGTEIEFNYAIDDADEVSYVIVDKKEYEALKNCDCKVRQHGMDFTQDELVDRILELEKLKTPTIENFVDEEPSSRRDILRCAEKCVCGKREQDYGTPESNFQLIADLWNDYLKKERSSIVVDAKDVAMLMALMKIARIRNGGGSGDSFVDLAGYAACGGEIWASNKETN